MGVRENLTGIEALVAQIRGELFPEPPPPPPPPPDVTVSDTAGLQQAIDVLSNRTIKVRPGDYDQITLRNGLKNLTLAADTSSLGTGRVTPEMSEAMWRVRRLFVEGRAEGYTLRGFKSLPVSLGQTNISIGSDTATDPLQVPNEIHFDQSIVAADDNIGGKRGIAANCRVLRVTRSHLGGFWFNSGDSQAICGWNGPGPFFIEDNYLEGGGMSAMWGGGDCRGQAMQPTFVTFRRNTCTKPLAWKGTAKDDRVKNVLEFKNVLGALVEENLFEHSWTAGQTGFLILLSIRNQDGTNPFATVSNVAVRWNVCRNAGAGVSILGRDDIHHSARMTNVAIEDNLFYNIDTSAFPGYGRFFLINNGPLNLSIQRNTCVGRGLLGAVQFAPNRNNADFLPADNLQMLHNIMSEGAYGIGGDGASGFGLQAFLDHTVNSRLAENVFMPTPTNTRVWNYGAENQKMAREQALDAEFRSMVPGRGVNIEELRRRVVY